jgi:hypothetical protein
MGLGKDVYDEEGTAPIVLKKVYIIYDKYIGPDSVFPVSNGAPRIMTKFKDQPYTYELQPEYARSECLESPTSVLIASRLLMHQCMSATAFTDLANTSAAAFAELADKSAA